METITQEDRDLLINDLCARLPFGIKVLYDTQIFEVQYIEPMYEEIKLLDNERYTLSIDEVKPYLFPLSSMTEEHQRELNSIGWYFDNDTISNSETYYSEDTDYTTHTDCCSLIDWLNKNHFDYRGLIPKGLAIDATGLNIY
jgi:hypothetical protein